MSEKKTTVTYKIIRALISWVYQKTQILGLEHLPAEPCIIVGNHCQLNSPLVAELRFPGKLKIWTAGQMMAWKAQVDPRLL